MVVDDAREAIAATANLTDRTLMEARHQLANAMETMRDAASRLEDAAAARARDADSQIRQHPYAVIGLAVAVGALLGVVGRLFTSER